MPEGMDPAEATGDDEPSQASPGAHHRQVGWCRGFDDDFEVNDGDDEEGDTGIADSDAFNAGAY